MDVDDQQKEAYADEAVRVCCLIRKQLDGEQKEGAITAAVRG